MLKVKKWPLPLNFSSCLSFNTISVQMTAKEQFFCLIYTVSFTHFYPEYWESMTSWTRAKLKLIIELLCPKGIDKPLIVPPKEWYILFTYETELTISKHIKGTHLYKNKLLLIIVYSGLFSKLSLLNPRPMQIFSIVLIIQSTRTL